MPLSTTTNQNTELAKPVTRVAYFVEFHFKTTGILRVSTLAQTYNWGGYDWIGVGSLASIDAVSETEQVISQPLNFSLNITQASIFDIASGDPAEYRGGQAKMYMCPLNDQFQLIDTPVICWRGFMDMLAMSIDSNGGGVATMKCETSAYGLRKLPTLRMNAAQQKLKHPADTGFDYLTELISRPEIWFTAEAQRTVLG